MCGVSLIIHAEVTAAATRAGMLAPDGRCKTLNSSADGYARAEACVVHQLEVEEAAAPDGQLGSGRMLVLGTGINQDGRSSSLTAPHGPSQQQLVRSVLEGCSLSPVLLDSLEMHGTGTPLGDPIEIAAALAVLQTSALPDASSSGQPLELHAAKSRLGHTEPAAGAMGLSQVRAYLILLSNVVLLCCVHSNTLAPIGYASRVQIICTLH